MNKRVVPLEKSKKCLKGHADYLGSLEQEYKNPEAYGSLNAVIRELDDMSKNEGEFQRNLSTFLEETESTRTRFVTLAMLGINPGESHWG